MKSSLQNMYEQHNDEDLSKLSLPIYRNKRIRSNFRIFWELVKKQFLVRLRSPASLIEILLSFVFFLLVVPVDKISSSIIPEVLNPTPSYDTYPIAKDIIYFFLASKSTPVIAGPKTNPVISLMNYLYSSFLRYTPLKVEYYDDENAINERVGHFDVNGFGIFWENSDKEDFLTHPIIRTYTRCVTTCPTSSMFREIRKYITSELIKIDPENSELKKLVFINSSLQEFASPPYRKYKQLIHVPLMLIGSVIILSTMPDLEILIIEKYTKLMPLYFLMGCSETIFYLSFYFVTFIFSIFPNLTMSLFYCFYHFMTSVSFSLFFVANILYALAFISMSLFMLTLFRNARISRFYCPFMFIFNIAAVLLVSYKYDPYWPLDISSSKYVFFIPQFSFLLIVCSLRVNSIYQNIYINWSNLAQPELEYNISKGLLYLAIDSILYIILFIISYSISNHYSKIKNKILSLFHIQKSKNYQNSFNDNDVALCDINDNNFFIRITDLSKTYQQSKKKKNKNIVNSNDINDDRALKSVSFDVKKNEIIVITGPNGAGKTTLINILSSVIKPSNGHLEFNQNNLEIENENDSLTLKQAKELKPTALEEENDNSLSEFLLAQKRTKSLHDCEISTSSSEFSRTDDFSLLRPYIGVVFQEDVFVSYLSVRENLHLFGAFRGISNEDIEIFIDFFSNTLQMKDSLFKLAKDLSGGQKRKLCLAIALIGNPSILLLDEPTSGVDVQGRQLIWKLISSLNTTSIVTTHGLEEAEAASSRIFLINRGKIPFTGNSAELREKFNCGYMIKFDNGSAAAHAALDVIQKEVLMKKNLNLDMAKIKNEFLDTVYIPICPEMADCLNEIEKKKDELNIGDYSIFIEQLEDLILRNDDII